VVVQLMNKCPLGSLMAHAMGALHNIMLTDSKASVMCAPIRGRLHKHGQPGCDR